MSVISSKTSEDLEFRVFNRTDSPTDFEQAIALRREIFVDEQGGPIEDEPDGYDDEATHWLLMKQETALATGRLFSYQESCQMRPVAKIGRVAVAKALRGQRLGERVMREMMSHARREGFEQCILDAQTSAMAFYERLGFIAEGSEFVEGGILHCRMRLKF